MDQAMQFLPLILIVVLMYFLMIRPQQKKQKQLNEMRRNIKRGDKVQSAGGIVGRVIKVKDDLITIETGRDKVRLEFVRSSLTVMEASPATVVREEQPEEKMEEYEGYSEDVQDADYEDYDLDEGDYFDGDEYDGEYVESEDAEPKK